MTYNENMARGTVRLKGRELADKHNKSLYRIHKDGDLAYGTVHRLVNDDESGFSADTLYSFLVGLGLTRAQIADLKLGDVFEFVDYGAVE